MDSVFYIGLYRLKLHSHLTLPLHGCGKNIAVLLVREWCLFFLFKRLLASGQQALTLGTRPAFRLCPSVPRGPFLDFKLGGWRLVRWKKILQSLRSLRDSNSQNIFFQCAWAQKASKSWKEL